MTTSAVVSAPAPTLAAGTVLDRHAAFVAGLQQPGQTAPVERR